MIRKPNPDAPPISGQWRGERKRPQRESQPDALILNPHVELRWLTAAEMEIRDEMDRRVLARLQRKRR